MYVDLALPPGLYANGTEYQSSGRYFDANFIRFYEGQIRPVGGWRALSNGIVRGAAREIVTWRANDGSIWAGIGTHSNLYTMTRSGALHDITPVGFTVGSENGTLGGGYGLSSYGAGAYGLPIISNDVVTPATVWSLDQWGENLIGVSDTDGTIYEWVPPNTGADALPVLNAPPTRSLVVTDQRIVMALGADDDVRKVRWSDQEDNTNWDVADISNQAGEFFLETEGELLGGVKTARGALLFTDSDVWLATYVGTPFVYTFERVGQIDGPVSRNAMIETDSDVFWMGDNGFYSYTGIVRPLKCEVSDRVFRDLNRAQISKVTTFHNSAFNEVWWYYPCGASNENDRYVCYSYREGHWSTGKLTRLSAVDRSPFPNPLAVGEDGRVYEHEVGFNHHGNPVFLEGGPVELGNGDNVHHAHKWIPDQDTVGDVDVTLITRIYPRGEECTFGPYAMSEQTDIRISGRQTKMRYEARPNVDFRIGHNRVDVRQRGRR